MALNTDQIRLILNYTLAFLALVGSFILLIVDTPTIEPQAKLGFCTLLVGSVMTWAFTRETQAQTGAQVNKARDARDVQRG